MSKHTPGPWTAGEAAWFRGRMDPSDGKRPITAGAHGVIANVYGEANAILIASAPELLEALRDLREACTDAYKAGRIPAEPFVRAGNVLAKAEGEK